MATTKRRVSYNLNFTPNMIEYVKQICQIYSYHPKIVGKNRISRPYTTSPSPWYPLLVILQVSFSSCVGLFSFLGIKVTLVIPFQQCQGTMTAMTTITQPIGENLPILAVGAFSI